jgi:UDP-2-acetamido-2-deoxy-ribo-hexuluronate aminotransferase
MVDLRSQYLNIKEEIDKAIHEVIDTTSFINGPQVNSFKNNLEDYLGVKHVIPCANGTDSLQIAMMALDLQPGDEVIVPAFTYVATAEVIALLGLKPIMVDVDPLFFNIDVSSIEQAISPRTKAIVPVHLFGQAADMESIMKIADRFHLYVIEDNAQAIGANYYFKDGTHKKLGTIGHIGSTSFFPSKNLGCFGDGGALMTNDVDLAKKMRMIANHGQSVKYIHDTIGCNSRLDTLQAAVLNVKLNYLDSYSDSRNRVADAYDSAFANIDGVIIPARTNQSNHVFHQYTLRVKDGKRDALKKHLETQGVPSMIYYPIPLYKQKAFAKYVENGFILPVTEQLCSEVLSLPIHTEMSQRDIIKIIESNIQFFNINAELVNTSNN